MLDEEKSPSKTDATRLHASGGENTNQETGSMEQGVGENQSSNNLEPRRPGGQTRSKNKLVKWIIGIVVLLSVGLSVYYLKNQESIKTVQDNQANELSFTVENKSNNQSADKSAPAQKEAGKQIGQTKNDATNKYPSKNASLKVINPLPVAQSIDKTKPIASIGNAPKSAFSVNKSVNTFAKLFNLSTASAESDNTTILYMKPGDKTKTDIWGYSVPLKSEKKLVSTEHNDTYPLFSNNSLNILFESLIYSNIQKDEIGRPNSATGITRVDIYDILKGTISTPDNPYQQVDYVSGSAIWSPDSRFIIDKKYLYDTQESKFYVITQPDASNTNGLIESISSYPVTRGMVFSDDGSKIYSIYSGKKGDSSYPDFITEYDIYNGGFRVVVSVGDEYDISNLEYINGNLYFQGIFRMKYDLINNQLSKVINIASDYSMYSMNSYLFDTQGNVKVIAGTSTNEITGTYHLYTIVDNKSKLIVKNIGPGSRIIGWLGDTNNTVYVNDAFPSDTNTNTRYSIRVVNLIDNQVTELVKGILIDSLVE